MLYILPETVTVMNKKLANGGFMTIAAGDPVIVSRTGKIKTSGTVTIDGVKYFIDSATYTVDNDKTTVID